MISQYFSNYGYTLLTNKQYSYNYSCVFVKIKKMSEKNNLLIKCPNNK